ncbi:glycoside hydrolase family 30 beta sandwich domain-containing protein [uncultured Dokdonia sp.]|uniref:glycoside hydrolase family 30 protein n=1 Tax=uncultured Dokdonia sp. TaxID=575653 RepID=UPI0026184CAC|nr:glycoside hydrolase family 30 beta sandwich domain-containing protein [uncultured Dokdonia sp.]
MKKKLLLLGLLLCTITFYNCNDDPESSDSSIMPEETSNDSEDQDTSTSGEVRVVITTPDENSKLRELPNQLPFTDQNTGSITITVDEFDTAQTIEGFGGALTGSSAFLLNNNTEALNELFSENGIRLSYTRLTVGASDFNRNGSYTYNEITSGEDLNLDQFSINEDFTNNNPIIPVAQNIISINNEMKFKAAPWTAPRWMKNNNSFNGGSLQSQYFSVYADYLVKYLEEYQNNGITIDAISTQNEPLFENNSYPTMKMTAQEQIAFIGSHLGPALENSNVNPIIIGYDHNFRESEDPNFPNTLLSDPVVASFTNSIAYHAYAGQPSDIDALRAQFPDVNIYFTEQSGIQNAGTTFQGEIDFFMKTIFTGTLRRGAKTILLWNLALDENGGPRNGGCQVCRGILTIDSSGNYVKNVDYYILGHFSKYVDAGAQVISTNSLQGVLENVAFKNPDGSKVLVVYNSSNDNNPQDLNVNVGDRNFKYLIPRGALVTFKWN